MHKRISSDPGLAATVVACVGTVLLAACRECGTYCQSAAAQSTLAAAVNRDVAHPPSFSLMIGDSVDSCRKKVSYQEVAPGDFLNRYPFDKRLSFLRGRPVVAWRSEDTGSDGWPKVLLFAVFADQSMRRMTDLLSYRSGETLPEVEGEFVLSLKSVKAGMDVSRMYEIIGHKDCEYVLNAQGRWIVRFVYRGSSGSFFTIEADAATGRVIHAGNSTI